MNQLNAHLPDGKAESGIRNNPRLSPPGPLPDSGETAILDPAHADASINAAEAFHRLRETMGWSRAETAAILGLSRKAVESYELGWRKVPARVWKQALTVAAIQRKYPMGTKPCWELTRCHERVSKNCLCRKLTDGRFCWMTVTQCCHLAHLDKQMGFENCLSCPVIRQFLLVDTSALAPGADATPASTSPVP